ncbi:hypothetical protein CUR95_23975 [Bordetella bronchiseptica]|nr:hypothetical protein [Bordetella bronchiseptica]
MATPEEFARLYGPAAARAGQALGVAPEILLGQFGLETGWGKSVVPGTNNLGNIKDFSGSGVAATDNMTGSRDRYRQYESPEAFFDDYVSLIQRKYPAAVGAGDDAEKFGRALKFGGYAEDPAYVPKVASAAGMVRNLGDKLAEFLIPAAHAGTLPTGKIDPALVKWDDDAIDPAQVVWDEPGQGAGAGQTSTAIGPDGVMRVSMAHEGAPQAGAPAPERTMLDRVGRQVGLTARAGVSGLTGLASMGTNAAVDGINAMFGTEIPRADVNATLSAIGLPEPENATERVAQDVVGGMAGAGGVAKLAQTVSNPLVNTVGQRVASLLGTAPGMQVASAAAGAGAAGAAREGGAGAGGQLVAGLAGGLGPALASAGAAGAVRGLVRGGKLAGNASPMLWKNSPGQELRRLLGRPRGARCCKAWKRCCRSRLAPPV